MFYVIIEIQKIEAVAPLASPVGTAVNPTDEMNPNATISISKSKLPEVDGALTIVQR